MSSAVESWSQDLEAWAIPQALLDGVDDSPYGWPQTMWKRRSELAREETEESPTSGIARRLLGERGSLLDVGAGRGRASLALAAEGHSLVAVERDQAMASGLAEEALASGIHVEVIERQWPDAAEGLEPVRVVISAHVVYDCADIGPFVAAMDRLAENGVVLEVTDTHPWSSLAPYYRALHNLERPAGPTVEDLGAVIEEVVGVRPTTQRWTRSGQVWFTDWDEIIEFFGRRLVLPASRRQELRRLLEPDVIGAGDRLFVGEPVRDLATVWWTHDPLAGS